MSVSFCPPFVQFVTGLAVAVFAIFCGAPAEAEEIDKLDGAGVIEFFGTINLQEGNHPIIDLGDAHGLHEADEVAVFRAHSGLKKASPLTPCQKSQPE
jgi:hypothetical protein